MHWLDCRQWFTLDLVYNPSGAYLTKGTKPHGKGFYKGIEEDFDIQFHKPFAITQFTKLPRFLEIILIASENYED